MYLQKIVAFSDESDQKTVGGGCGRRKTLFTRQKTFWAFRLSDDVALMPLMQKFNHQDSPKNVFELSGRLREDKREMNSERDSERARERDRERENERERKS